MNKDPFFLNLSNTIRRYLYSFYLIESDSVIKKVKETTKLISPYKEIHLDFKYSLFVKNRFNLIRDIKHKNFIINSIRKIISQQDSVVNTDIEFLNGRQVGEYCTVDFGVKVVLLKEIEKKLNKYKFISKK